MNNPRRPRVQRSGVITPFKQYLLERRITVSWISSHFGYHISWVSRVVNYQGFIRDRREAELLAEELGTEIAVLWPEHGRIWPERSST